MSFIRSVLYRRFHCILYISPCDYDHSGLKLVGGKQKGDVDFDGVSQVASILTPTPGGVGPLTVAMVIRNTLYAAQKEYKFDFKSIRE